MPERKIFLIILLILSLLVLTGCAIEALAYDRLPIIRDEAIYFKDDFSDVRSGWQTEKSDSILKKYDKEGFWIIISEPYTKAWSVPGMNFKDVMLEVTAAKITGEDNNAIGLVCRYQDDANYYRFVIGSDGYYGIAKVVAGKESLLRGKVMDYSKVIKPGDEENRIRAICEGENLSLSVNGQLLVRVEDADLRNGDIGILAENRGGSNLAVLFSNFLAAKP